MAKTWKAEESSARKVWKPGAESGKTWKPQTTAGSLTNPVGYIEKPLAQGMQAAGEWLQQHPTLSKGVEAVGDFVAPINKMLEPISHAAGAGLEQGNNFLASIYNVPASGLNKVTGVDLRAPHLDLSRYHKNDLAADFGRAAGDVATLPLGGAVFKGANALATPIVNTAMKLAPEAIKSSSYAAKLGAILQGMGTGGATGFALGEDREGNRGWGTALGAGLGGVIPGAKLAAHTAKDLFQKGAAKLGYQPAEKVMQTVAKEAPQILKNTASDAFNDAFKIAKDKGITKANIKEKNVAPFLESLTEEERASITTAFKTKNLEDIHTAAKEAGEHLRSWRKEAGKRKLLDHERKIVQSAKVLKDNLYGALEGAFKKTGDPRAQQLFNKGNSIWKEYLKYARSKILTKFNEGDLTAKRAVKQLYKNDYAEKHFHAKHPEIVKNIELPEKFRKILMGTGKATGALAGGAAVHSLFSNRNH
jgi:hypothetical protein